MAKKYNLYLKGYVGGYDFDSDYVDYVLKQNEGQEVNVLIDSLGGSVASALSISSAFKRHGKVNVHFVGMNASAATIASLGAAHISMDSSAMYLVHKCSNYIFDWGTYNADELQTLIEKRKQQQTDLEKIDDNIASMYVAKCKKPQENLLKLMKIGGWLTSKEALDNGFVDEITDNAEDISPKIDDASATAMANAGIPLPNMPGEKDSFMSKILAMMSSFFTANTPKILNSMRRTFNFVCEILQMEALDAEEGKITLTETQMQSIEDRLSALSQQVSQLEADLESKNTQIENLMQNPAENTTEVVETSKSDSDFATSYMNSLNEAQQMFNSIP